MKTNDRLHDDRRHDHAPQQRERDLEEQPERTRAVDDGRLVEFLRNGRHESTEQQDAEGHAVRDLDEASPPMVLKMPRRCMTQIVGTTAGGTMSPGEDEEADERFQRLGRRASTQPIMADSTTMTVTDTTVRIVLLMNATHQHVVVRLEDLDDVLEERELGRPA